MEDVKVKTKTGAFCAYFAIHINCGANELRTEWFTTTCYSDYPLCGDYPRVYDDGVCGLPESEP